MFLTLLHHTAIHLSIESGSVSNSKPSRRGWTLRSNSKGRSNYRERPILLRMLSERNKGKKRDKSGLRSESMSIKRKLLEVLTIEKRNTEGARRSTYRWWASPGTLKKQHITHKILRGINSKHKSHRMLEMKKLMLSREVQELVLRIKNLIWRRYHML